jgi:DNA-binding CsgD family transcriptional regulator
MGLHTLARRLQQAQNLPEVADAVISELAVMPGVLAVAFVGFDRAGHPSLWIGDDQFEPKSVEGYLGGRRGDPCEDRATDGASLRALPIAGTSDIAGAIRVVVSATHPPWSMLALIGAQVSVRLAALGIGTPLADHLEPVRLSDRQRQIAWLVARGCTNAEIANMLGCTSHAVKKQISRVLGLLDLTNRTELAALTAGWSDATTLPRPSSEPRRNIYLARMTSAWPPPSRSGE